MKKNKIWLVVLALSVVYVFWSGYIAISLAVKTIPPLIMNGSRFVASGMILFFIAVISGQKLPSKKEIINASIAGILLFFGGTGLVAMAMTKVSSSISAIAISTVPVWAVLIIGFTGKWPNKYEWTGVAAGICGIVLLNFENEMQANASGAILLILASVLWAGGSVVAATFKMPEGIMGNAVAMLAGGIVNYIAAVFLGEKMIGMPSAASLAGISYLIIFSGVIGFSAYIWLFKNTSPALATSYAYVNPIGAILIGVGVAGEKISYHGLLALVAILVAVVLVAYGQKKGFNKNKV